MFKTTWRGLVAHKLRLVTTGLAILLGVAFMSGALVLTDTIGKTFDDLFADANAGTDAYVRNAAFVETDFGEERPNLSADLVEEVEAVDGVAVADGQVNDYARLVDKEGDPMGNPDQGAPTFGFDWPQVEELNPFTLVAGREPQGGDEVVIDRNSAEEADYEVGDEVPVLFNRSNQEFTLVGIVRFGEADSPGGASVALFTDETAQRYMAGPNEYTAIAVVAEEGVSEREVTDAIDAALGSDVEVLTGAELTEENQSDIEEALSFFDAFLLTFAGIALFVGSFIIYNTFSIIVAQRSRENALLRAIGASRRQVLSSVLGEALAVAIVASALGLLVGIGVAAGLKALLSGFGIDIPATGLVLTTSTVITAMVTGVLVTVVAAFVPARRASRIPPVAAMRDVAHDTSAFSRTRLIVGSVVAGLGVLSLLNGLFSGGDNALPQVGFGVLLIYLGGATLGPIVARPVSWVLGWPMARLRGMPGALARENAMRNPKRTSATAAALTIGVSLVGFITIFAASAKASIDKVIDEAFTGDFVIDSGTFSQGGLPPELSAELNAVPEVGVATGVRFKTFEIDGQQDGVIGVDPATVQRIIDVGVLEGSYEALEEEGVIAVLQDEAEDEGWQLGDRIPVRFAETGEQELTVGMIYEEDQPAGKYVLGVSTFEANYPDSADFQVYVDLADGVSAAEGRAAVERVADQYPQAEVLDNAEFAEQQGAFVDQLLGLIYAMLALAIVIALLGIANTLALSIFERTRELGLLRAVGMTRAQLRSTVRWESVIIALLGTALGLAIGVFFGWAMVEALSDEGITEFRVAPVSLIVVALLAGAAGIIAAIPPARRAAKLDVLAAVTHV